MQPQWGMTVSMLTVIFYLVRAASGEFLHNGFTVWNRRAETCYNMSVKILNSKRYLA